jgi:hypothetical protein
MLWMTVTFVAGLVTLMVVIHRKRSADVHALGSVSQGWIADHLMD